jgi:hypothetical protein
MTTLVNRKQSEPNANSIESASEASNLVAIAQRQASEANQNEDKSAKEKAAGTGHVSRLKSKQPGTTRRTNSLADLFIPRRTPTPQQNPTSGNGPAPKRVSSEKKSEFQRLCCSFRRTRRAKTALDLGIKRLEIQEVLVPSYGTINSSAMSAVNDPQVARRGIMALEKSMTKTLCSQMSRIMSVDEDPDAQPERTAPRPNGFATELKSKPENGKSHMNLLS